MKKKTNKDQHYEKSSPGMGREDERDDKTPEVGKKCQLQAFD